MIQLLRILCVGLMGLLATGIGSCGNDAFRDEQVTKLRVLGVASTPQIITADAGSVTLTVHLVAPTGNGISATIGTATSALSLPDGVVVDSTLVSAFSNFDYHQVNLSYTVPTGEAIGVVNPTDGANLDYLVTLGDGTTSVVVDGNVAVVHPDLAQSADAPLLAATIDAPVGPLTAGSEATITGSYGNEPIEESYKIGWLVSGGEIENRRALSTEWTVPGPGTASLILTVRGQRSGAFSVAIQDVPIN